MTLVVLNHLRRDLLHLRVTASHVVVRYSPGLVGSITTIWFRTVIRSYFRWVPYVTMASVSGLVVGRDQRSRRFIYSLNGMSTTLEIDPQLFKDLAQNGHWFTFWLQVFNGFNVLFLTQLKGAFFAVSPDPNGWHVNVSNGLGYGLMFLYSLFTRSLL